MTMIFDKNTPAPQLTEDVLRKVNALGHEPRVVIEFDKLSYVPGMKNRFTVWDRILETSITHEQSNTTVIPPITEEPKNITSGGESGDRFEYIKCSFNKQVKAYKLPDQAYYFLLAVAKHETAFGTLGQGRPEKGSFIVGYGCPGSCDFTYSGIDTQTKYAAKRFADAMKSRFSAINSRGYLTASDVDYFHQGGDKGYNKWVWSADGANWKSKVKMYYDDIRAKAMQTVYPNKWHCKDSNSIGYANMSPTANTVETGCATCEEEEVYVLTPEEVEIFNKAVEQSGGGGLTTAVFPIEGISLGNGARVSSHQMRNSNGRPGHKGIDLVHQTQGKVNGMWVVAAWGGKVTRSYYSTSYGNCVMIMHPNGYGTVYAHMQNNSVQVRQGATVSAGQRLGRVGNTGNSYGAHLHFEIWKGGWVYGGSGHIDPYPVLLGTQKIGVDPVGGGGDSGGSGTGGGSPAPMEITKNVVFNKCFDKDAALNDNWIGKENIKHFTALWSGEKYIGFEKNIKKGEVKDFGFKHNFSADGFYEYAYYAQLGDGDSVTVSLDGVMVKRYTKSDNTKNPTYESPIYSQYVTDSTEGANSHILDFTIDNVSGTAIFGIKCFKTVEVETKNGTQVVNSKVTARKRDVWLDTGAFVFDQTFTLDKDIMNWEVNTHFDQRVGTARVTLDNKYGLYSPSYERTTVFPENRRESEMSYYEEGAIRHVLSEATPVRIYAGYGENLVRVFTGRIKGEVEEDADEKTITINMVDMYDYLEEHVFDKEMSYPDVDEISGDEKTPSTLWVKSAIVHNIVNEAGLINWRIVEDDLMYPDTIIEETYYIDIDKGGKKAVVWDAKKKRYVEKNIATVKDAYGYKNPYVQSIAFQEGTRAADAIQELVGDIMYRAYCDRYGTFHLENIRNLTAANAKWEFVDGENLHALTTAVDHSRVRNHLMILGSMGTIEHFVDKDLLVATKGSMRTAKIVAEWIDERFGATARGTKEDMANKLFFDMKRQARTFSTIVKGNPMIEVLDGCYVYDRNTSNAGYYIVKGNRLVGDEKGMVNHLELTWKDEENFFNDEPIYNIPPETSPENVEGTVKCGATINTGGQRKSFTHDVTENGYVYIQWDMYGAADSIDVYVGGKKKYSSNGLVSDGTGGPIGFYYKKSQGKIEVRINESGKLSSSGTQWEYTLYCPGTAPSSVTSKARHV